MNLLNRPASAIASLIYRDPDPADLGLDAEVWTGLNRDLQANAKRAREWRREREAREREKEASQ